MNPEISFGVNGQLSASRACNSTVDSFIKIVHSCNLGIAIFDQHESQHTRRTLLSSLGQSMTKSTKATIYLSLAGTLIYHTDDSWQAPLNIGKGVRCFKGHRKYFCLLPICQQDSFSYKALFP